MITLKDHNVKPYGELCAMLEKDQKCAYVAATGTGKSYVVGKYIEDNGLKDKTLILVPLNSIKESWESLIPGIDVCTYASLHGRKDGTEGKELIVCDEMHHLGATEWGAAYQEAIRPFKGKVVGLTATPIRFLDGGRNMVNESFDGKVVEGMDLPAAIVAGILPSFDYITALYNLPERYPSDKGRNGYTEQLFNQLDMMKSAYSFQNILRKHLKTGAHKVAVFVNGIDEISEIKELCADVYPEASHYIIHSRKKSSEIKNTMEKFKSDTGMSFVYTVDMLNEGVHIDGVDCVIMFRKTESPAIYLQQIGCALSSDMAGKRVKIFDFVANHRNLKAIRGGSGLVMDWIIEGTGNSERQIAISDYALEELELLNKLKAVLDGGWMPEEDDLLRDKYDHGKGFDELMKLLPHRSRAAIAGRAAALGLRKEKNRYPEEFLEDLKKLYARDNGIELLAAKYPQFAIETIRAKANMMGLTRIEKREKWTVDEERILKENSKSELSELEELLPGRSRNSILKKRKNMGLSPEKRKWSNEDDEILKTHENMTAKELQEKFFPDINIGSINQRRHKILGVPTRDKFWNEERLSRIKDAYLEGGAEAVQKLSGYEHLSTTAIESAARKNRIMRCERNPWTDDEISKINTYLDTPKENRPPMQVLYEQIPNHGKETIGNKKREIEKRRQYKG